MVYVVWVGGCYYWRVVELNLKLLQLIPAAVYIKTAPYLKLSICRLYHTYFLNLLIKPLRKTTAINNPNNAWLGNREISHEKVKHLLKDNVTSTSR